MSNLQITALRLLNALIMRAVGREEEINISILTLEDIKIPSELEGDKFDASASKQSLKLIFKECPNVVYTITVERKELGG